MIKNGCSVVRRERGREVVRGGCRGRKNVEKSNYKAVGVRGKVDPATRRSVPSHPPKMADRAVRGREQGFWHKDAVEFRFVRLESGVIPYEES